MYPTLPFWTAMLATEIFNNNTCYNCVSRKELEFGLTFLKTCLKLWQCHHKRQLLRINPSPSMWHYQMSGKANYQARFARRTLWYFSAFFNHSVLEYTIPLTSKLILLCVTVANLSHFDSHWILLLKLQNFDSTLPRTVYILRVFSSPILSTPFFSLLSTLFYANYKEHAHTFTTDRLEWAYQLADIGRSNICWYWER